MFVISRNDRTLASENFCGYADVWSLPSGRLLRQVNEGGEASSVDLSPNGSRLLVSSWDSRATIWSVRTGRPLVNLIGHTRGISAAGFSPDGQIVVSVSLDHTVRLWNAHTGQQLRVLTFPYDQDAFSFSANGQQLAITELTPVVGVDDVVRVFGTCPDCTNPRGLLRDSAKQVTTHLTELERTVVDAAHDG
jgi:WD40 repeat protein